LPAPRPAERTSGLLRARAGERQGVRAKNDSNRRVWGHTENPSAFARRLPLRTQPFFPHRNLYVNQLLIVWSNPI
jgi:hypothetical protein